MSDNDIYLRLTKEEVEDIKYALMTQYDNSDNLNIDGSENDELIAKINYQEGSICRPYVVNYSAIE